MLAGKRPIVHFVAQAASADAAPSPCRAIRNNRRHKSTVMNRAVVSAPIMLQKIRQPRAAEAANHVPAFDAHVPRILPDFGQGLNLVERVLAGLLHRAADGQGPVLENDSRIIDVVVVDGKFLERRELGVRESRAPDALRGTVGPMPSR